MRKAFFDQFEAVARRAPGWGTKIESRDAEGKPAIITVSKSWFMRQLGGESLPAQPRKDKGTGYTYDKNGTRRLVSA